MRFPDHVEVFVDQRVSIDYKLYAVVFEMFGFWGILSQLVLQILIDHLHQIGVIELVITQGCQLAGNVRVCKVFCSADDFGEQCLAAILGFLNILLARLVRAERTLRKLNMILHSIFPSLHLFLIELLCIL